MVRSAAKAARLEPWPQARRPPPSFETPAARDKALAALHERSVDEAAFLWVAHDVGPRAMTPKIKNFVQPKSWFVDFSTMTMN